MKYRFEIEDFTAKKKLPRDERYDITQYITSLEIEAEDSRRASRILADMANARLSRESDECQAIITLPDYGSCQLVLKVVSE